MTIARTLTYNVSTVEKDSLKLLKTFVSHWLSGFCSGNYDIHLREDSIDYSKVYIDVDFSEDRDCLIAVLKDFPPELSKFRVIH